jgi:signal transduction histidine kinase
MGNHRGARAGSLTALAAVVAAGVACSLAVVISVFGTSGAAALVVGASAVLGLVTWAIAVRLDRQSAIRATSLLPPVPVTTATGEDGAHRLITQASTRFRSPLTGIYGMSQIIEQDATAPPHVKQFAAVISSAAADLTRMVEDVVTCAQLDAGSLPLVIEDLDAAHETRIAIKPFERRLCELSVSCEPGDVRADRAAIRQILRNLLSNALCHGGGAIDVDGRVEADRYRWTIRDDGPGLRAQTDRTPSDPMGGSSTHDDPGIGLGLAVARGLARDLGGELSYGRVRGLTEFSFAVPLVVTQRRLQHV